MKFWRENKETLINFAEFVYNNKNFTYDYIKKRFKFDKSNDNAYRDCYRKYEGNNLDKSVIFKNLF